MSLLIGTEDGCYLVEDVPFDRDEPEQVLDCGMVTAIEPAPDGDAVYLAARSGAYRSTDGGREWEDLGVPLGDRYWHAGTSEVWSILPAADGALYAGTNDPFCFRSTDDGATWTECKGFRDLPSRGHWESPEDPHYARLRSLEHVPGRPDSLIAGVEAGGIHLSDDGGRTWRDRRDAIVDDVHQVLPLTEDVWLAATGYLDLTLEAIGYGHALGDGGLWRTVDGGDTWRRLDVADDHAYIRCVFAHDGTLFFGGLRGAPPAWVDDDHEAALFESTTLGRDAQRVPYPGEPHEVVEAWTVHCGALLCASGRFDVPVPRDDVEGRLMRRGDDGTYETVGWLPSNVGRLASV